MANPEQSNSRQPSFGASWHDQIPLPPLTAAQARFQLAAERRRKRAAAIEAAAREVLAAASIVGLHANQGRIGRALRALAFALSEEPSGPTQASERTDR